MQFLGLGVFQVQDNDLYQNKMGVESPIEDSPGDLLTFTCQRCRKSGFPQRIGLKLATFNIEACKDSTVSGEEICN